MTDRIQELAEQAKGWAYAEHSGYTAQLLFEQKFAELIVAECTEQVEQAKNSPFVSLDDAKRMSHFVDVTKKRIEKHFRS